MGCPHHDNLCRRQAALLADSERALERALEQISVVLDTLQKACVMVKITKSEVLIPIRPIVRKCSGQLGVSYQA